MALLQYLNRLPQNHPLLERMRTVRSIPKELGRKSIDLQGIQFLPGITSLDLEGSRISNIAPILGLKYLERLQLNSGSANIKPIRKELLSRTEVKSYQETIWEYLKNRKRKTPVQQQLLSLALLLYPNGLFHRITTPDIQEYKNQIAELLASNDKNNSQMAAILLESIGDIGLFSEFLADARPAQTKIRNRYSYTVTGVYFKKLSFENAIHALFRLAVSVPRDHRSAPWANGLFLAKEDNIPWSNFDSDFICTALDGVDWMEEIELRCSTLSAFPEMIGLQMLKLHIGTWNKTASFSFSVLENAPRLNYLFLSLTENPILSEFDALKKLQCLDTVHVRFENIDKTIAQKIASVCSYIPTLKNLKLECTNWNDPWKHKGTPDKVLQLLS